MMGAVWMRFRAELRRRWRAWLAVALFAGVFGGAVLAAAIGGQRADSVTDRSIARARPPDIFLVPKFATNGSPEVIAKLAYENVITFRSVADGVRAVVLETDNDYDVNAPVDERIGRTLLVPKIIEGRLPNQRRVDEASVNFIASEKLGLHAGDSYTLRFVTPYDFGKGELPKPGPAVKLRIVGVTADTTDVVSIAGPGFTLTRAFLQRYGSAISRYEFSAMYLRDKPGKYEEFRREIQQLTGGDFVFYVEGRSGAAQARRSFRLQGTSMWILAGFLVFVALLMLGQQVARQTFLDSSDYPTLRGLGFGRRQLFALSMLRATAIAAVGMVVAPAVGALGSIATPFGLARLIEPDPGMWMPATSLIAGLAGTFLGVIALALYPSWRAARTAGAGFGVVTASTERPSTISERVSRVTRGAASSVGTRMALDPGRGGTAVPVRTTIAGTAIGLISLVTALVIASSLAHLTATPRLYGFNWDMEVNGPDFGDPAARRQLEETPGVEKVSVGISGGTLVVNKQAVDVFTLEAGAEVHPPILEGRAPFGADEIALGRKTFRAVKARVGGTVDMRVQGQETGRSFRVVGVTVLPLRSDTSALGEGVWTTLDAEKALLPDEDIPSERALVRLERGADKKKVAAVLTARYDSPVDLAEPPGAVVDFGRVSTMPSALAGIVGLFAAGTLAHGVTTAVRRRRRDLAILKTLGFDRGEVRRAVVWLSSVTAFLTVAVALPLGVVLGRTLWILFAHQSGFVSEPVVGLGTLAAIVGGSLLLANIIGVLPARSAARTRPALVLRTE